MQPARAAHLPLAVPAAIGIAWCIAVAAQLSGSAVLLHHDRLIVGGPPIGIALALFLCAWLVMIVAMMLPSSLPFMRMFAIASANQPNHGSMLLLCFAGYAVVWFAFGAAAFIGDIALHRFVERAAWLAQHPWLISGAVLAAAGAFQFTPLKDACLRACRVPSNFLVRHYRRGGAAAFAIGYRHGAFCVGCCWALMLITFAAGFANLAWMAALTALMVFEKTAHTGREAVLPAGALLLGWSVLVLAHPPWLPRVLSGM